MTEGVATFRPHHHFWVLVSITFIFLGTMGAFWDPSVYWKITYALFAAMWVGVMWFELSSVVPDV